MERTKTTYVINNNKKANFNYDIKDKYIAGILIYGTEIKSIRDNACSLTESYCYVKDNNIFIKNMYIKKYEYGSDNNHDETRDRQLLLTKRETNKIIKAINEKGYSLVPMKVLTVNGWAKIELGIGKGKNIYDKKETLKDRDMRIDIDRELHSK